MGKKIRFCSPREIVERFLSTSIDLIQWVPQLRHIFVSCLIEPEAKSGIRSWNLFEDSEETFDPLLMNKSTAKVGSPAKWSDGKAVTEALSMGCKGWDKAANGLDVGDMWSITCRLWSPKGSQSIHLPCLFLRDLFLCIDRHVRSLRTATPSSQHGRLASMHVHSSTTKLSICSRWHCCQLGLEVWLCGRRKDSHGSVLLRVPSDFLVFLHQCGSARSMHLIVVVKGEDLFWRSINSTLHQNATKSFNDSTNLHQVGFTAEQRGHLISSTSYPDSKSHLLHPCSNGF